MLNNFFPKKLFVVTANYKDRSSMFKWLLRKMESHLSEALAYKAIVATGVEFKRSSIGESGFGCSMVAICEKVETFESLPAFEKSGLRRLKFNFVNFIDSETGEGISKVHSLYLDENGHMWAHIEKPKPTKILNQKKQKAVMV